MASVETLSDSELRRKLAEYGYPVGPVTDTSRKVLMKKLKLLMGQAGRSNDVTGASKWRRSSSHFSSGEEESENDDSKMRLNSTMPPPSSNFRNQKRRSTGRLSDYSLTTGRVSRKDANYRSDLFNTPKTAAIESELSKKKHQRVLSSPGLNAGSLSNSSVGRVLSRATVSSPANDGFETGSDSDIDTKKWDSSTGQVSSPSISPVSVPYSSFLSRLSSVRPRHNSDYSGGDSSSANTILGFRKSSELTSRSTNTPEVRGPTGSTYPPFQSNFVKRLSGLSSNTFGTRGSAPSSVFDVKENDDGSNSPNGLFTTYRRSGFSSHSDLSQEFKMSEDEAKFGCYSQFVSMTLVAVVALFFLVLAIMYVSVRSRDAVSFGLEDKANTFPVCSDVARGSHHATSEELCVDHQELMPAVKLARLLHPELNRRAISEQCYNGPSAMMTHRDVIVWLMKKNATEDSTKLEHHLRSLKMLLVSNSHWGIQVVDSAMGSTAESIKIRHLVDAGGLAVTDPDLPFVCYLKTKVQGILFKVMCIAVGICVLYGIKWATQWYIRRRERDKVEVYKMVERIIELLVNHQKNTSAGKQPFLAVNHIRDQLIPPPDRARLAKVWKQAVQWIKDSESRVRCEMQSIAGEEFPVWRWLPHASTCASSKVSSEQSTPRRNNKVWQGQAFDTMTGSPNSPPCSPTPCLKIRHMFDPDVEFGDEWPVRVQDSILEKCGEEGVVALHISVDRASRDGCVYLKCASQEDAGKAYRALHGWWFDSNLVTVKYLRLERYHERFPEAEGAIIPLTPSNNQKLSLQWQSPLDNN